MVETGQIQTTPKTPPTLEQLRGLKEALKSLKYKIRVGRELARQLYRATKLQLATPADIMGILLYDVPAYWNAILREEGAFDVHSVGEDVKAILQMWFKWLNSIGYVHGWTIEGEEDWEYVIGISYDTACHNVYIGLKLVDKVDTWLEYYNNFCRAQSWV